MAFSADMVLKVLSKDIMQYMFLYAHAACPQNIISYDSRYKELFSMYLANKMLLIQDFKLFFN